MITELRLSMSFRRSRNAQLRAPRLLSSGSSKDGKDMISLTFAGGYMGRYLDLHSNDLKAEERRKLASRVTYPKACFLHNHPVIYFSRAIHGFEGYLTRE